MLYWIRHFPHIMIMVTESKVINDINSRSDVAIIWAFILSLQVNYRGSFDTSMYCSIIFSSLSFLLWFAEWRMLSQQFLCSILSIYPFSVDWFIHHLHKRTHFHSTVTPQQRARAHSLLEHKFVQGETTHKCWFGNLTAVTRAQISGQGHMHKPTSDLSTPRFKL